MEGNTAINELHELAANGAPLEVIKQLLQVVGKSILLKSHDSGNTPLHIACSASHCRIDIIPHLIDVGGKELLTKKINHGKTALKLIQENPLIPIAFRHGSRYKIQQVRLPR